MYIGDTDDGTGLHHMVLNSLITPSMSSGWLLHKIFVTIMQMKPFLSETMAAVNPLTSILKKAVPAAEVIMTVLHSWKFVQ